MSYQIHPQVQNQTQSRRKVLKTTSLALSISALNIYRKCSMKHSTAMYDYLKVYNNQISQKVLKYQTPIQTLNEWQKKQPDIFVKEVYDHTGLDTFLCYLSRSDKEQQKITILDTHDPLRVPRNWIQAIGCVLSELLCVAGLSFLNRQFDWQFRASFVCHN